MYPLTVHFLVVTVVDSVCPKPCHKYSHIWVSPVTASKRKKNKSGFLQTSAVKGKKNKKPKAFTYSLNSPRTHKRKNV